MQDIRARRPLQQRLFRFTLAEAVATPISVRACRRFLRKGLRTGIRIYGARADENILAIIRQRVQQQADVLRGVARIGFTPADCSRLFRFST